MAKQLYGCLAAVLVLSLAGCGKPTGQASGLPVVANESALTDGAGRQVKFVANPRRIVSVSPAATDILVAENAHAQIVGATRFCNIPAADENHVIRIGGMVDPDCERIVALKPDLVIVPWLADKTLQEKLISLGLPVLVLHPESLSGTLADIRLIAEATGHALEGEARAKRIEDIRALAGSRWKGVPLANRPRVLIYMDAISPAPGSYVDDLLTAAGGRNAIPPGAKAWVELSRESALQLAPDVIINIPSPGQTLDANTVITMSKPTSLMTVADGAPFYHPGPDLGRALWALARAIDPARFPEAGPPASIP